MSVQKNNASDVRSALLLALGSSMSEEELDAYFVSHPGHVVALRGDASKFVNRSSPIPAYFMPESYAEFTPSVTASVNGADTIINFEDRLTIPIIVIQQSERYNQYGQNLVTVGTGGFNPWEPGSRPYIPGGSPVTCPNTSLLQSFSAEEVNGSILLTYNILALENPDDRIEITISRLDPGASDFEVIEVRDGNDANIFYDTELSEGINVQYIYRLSAIIFHSDEDGLEEECSATVVNGSSEFLSAQGGATTNIEPVASFVGQNISNTQISYTWSPPSNVSISEYRLSVLQDGQYQEVVIIDPTSNQFGQYTYDYPEEVRGTSVQMQIQYRSAGNTWVGDFFDRTYASFRNGDEPLRYYGARMDPVTFNGYELGEDQLNGGPEVRIVAARATSSSESDLPSLSENLVFTVSCCNAVILRNQFLRDNGERGIITDLIRWLSVCPQLGYTSTFVPINTVFENVSAPILDVWDNNLIGSAITILSTETDAPVVRVTEGTLTEEATRDIDADFGVKIPVIGDVEVGVETQHVTTEEYTLAYPGDLVLNRFQIFYHDPFIRDLGNEVFGYSFLPERDIIDRFGQPATLPEEELDPCTTLDQN